MRWLKVYRLPILSALAFNLTFYPWRLEWLIWIAAVPLLLWLSQPERTMPQTVAGLVMVGAIYHVTLLAPFLSLGWWGWGATSAEGVHQYFTYAHLFMVLLVMVVALWGGVVLAMIGQLIRPSLTNPLESLWLVPSLWVVVLEYLGHRTVFGFSWGLIGNRLHGAETIRQVARLTGVYGLSVLVMMVNALVASWVIHVHTTRRQPRKTPQRTAVRIPRSLFGATAIGLIVIGGSVLYGRTQLQQKISRALPISVTLLQGSRAEYTVDDFTSEGLDRLYEPMLKQAVGKGSTLVVLPETVWLKTLQLDGTTSPWAQEPLSIDAMQQLLAKLLRETSTVVIFGIDAVSGSRMYNTTIVWSKDGLRGVYRKRRLVPFSEYLPALLGRWAPQNRIHGEQFVFTPGEGSQLIRLNGVVLGPFICQEVMFPSLVRQSVRDGAQLLVTTGNDGVFTSPIVAWEQAGLAQLRAVENGRYLLRCMKSGISAIIDPQGRIMASAPLHAQMSVVGDVQPIGELTWYTRHGDWIAWLAGVLLLVRFVAYGVRARARAAVVR